MIDGKFTAKERAYLSSLPAVKSVSASHIRYSDRFRVEVCAVITPANHRQPFSVKRGLIRN